MHFHNFIRENKKMPEYSNTNKHLYDDIELWEKTEGKELFLEMPLNGIKTPQVLDFGYGFGEYLFALCNAYPEGMIYGIDRNEICQKEIKKRLLRDQIENVTLINKEVENLQELHDDSFDLVLLYDILHGGNGKLKYMLFEESHRILKPGACLSILPVHLSNWRDKEGKKKTYSINKIKEELNEYGFRYAGTCSQKGVHWEKCHTLYYIQKKNITFDILEKVDVMNFVKI